MCVLGQWGRACAVKVSCCGGRAACGAGTSKSHRVWLRGDVLLWSLGQPSPPTAGRMAGALLLPLGDERQQICSRGTECRSHPRWPWVPVLHPPRGFAPTSTTGPCCCPDPRALHIPLRTRGSGTHPAGVSCSTGWPDSGRGAAAVPLRGFGGVGKVVMEQGCHFRSVVF